jgi:hypothetical protein
MPLSENTFSARNRWLDGDGKADDPRYTLAHIWCEGQDDRQGQRIYLHRNDGDRCVAYRWESGQCPNKGKFEFESFNFCGLHYPPKLFEKIKARIEQNRIEQVTRDFYEDRRSWRSKCDTQMIKALKEIANGALNDPVGYAQLIIQELNDAEPSKPVEADGYERQRAADQKRRDEKRAGEIRKARDAQADRRAGQAQNASGSSA